MKTVLRAKNIQKAFGQEQVLKGIDLAIEENTFTTILGPSGSGKSTLLNILSGLIRPSEGEVFHEETQLTALSENQLADWKRTSAGNVFQNYLLLNNLTARENITIGLAPGRESLSFSRLVSILELDNLLDKFPSQLSGGQQQRVAIARGVIKSPSLLFCDEATGALDEANGNKVVQLLHTIKAVFGITILFTTHNLEIAKTADRVITMKDGLIFNDEMQSAPISTGAMVWG